jgi:hypothetical protein
MSSNKDIEIKNHSIAWEVTRAACMAVGGIIKESTDNPAIKHEISTVQIAVAKVPHGDIGTKLDQIDALEFLTRAIVEKKQEAIAEYCKENSALKVGDMVVYGRNRERTGVILEVLPPKYLDLETHAWLYRIERQFKNGNTRKELVDTHWDEVLKEVSE